MISFQNIAKKAGIELTDEIQFFAELLVSECAEIADSAYHVNLPAAPIMRRHFNLIEPKPEQTN